MKRVHWWHVLGILLMIVLALALSVPETLRAQIRLTDQLDFDTIDTSNGTLAGRAMGTIQDEETQIPVANAQITIEGQGISDGIVTHSDAKGYFAFDSIKLSDSIVPVTVTVTAEGYGLWQLTSVRLIVDDTLILSISLQPGNTPTVRSVPAPSAERKANYQKIEAQLPGLTPKMLEDLMQASYTIPSTIRVGRQYMPPWPECPKTGGEVKFTNVDVVDFKDYVKHVLPNEWYTTWSGESLRAGAMAVKMYAWYWISVGGKWGFRNPPADVVDSTCDQKYIPDVAYSSTNAAVDDTWDYYMTQNGKFFESSYCSNCEGVCGFCTCEEDCMGQYESEDLANQGWTWQQILKHFYANIEIRWLLCPRSTDSVIFYKDPFFSCGGEGEGVGYVQPLVSGYYELPESFGASSMRIAPGFYATLYLRNRPDVSIWRFSGQHGNDNFASWGYDDGTVCILVDDNIGAVEIAPDPGFCPVGLTSSSNSDCLPNKPPNAPAPNSPPDGYVALDYRAPTLCWTSQGDPDGDALEYYAEVYGSPINANSGWTYNNCWRPWQLDYQYYGYQWRVKARDPAQAQSGWSATRSFNIAAPNRPPSISFNTANGDSFPSGAINSRQRNWTFRGTANDPEGHLNRIEWRCSGDNCGSGTTQSSGANWSLARNGMAGQNDVYFVAYDDAGHYSFSRHLDLRIDLAAPSTQASLNGEANPAYWPTWFTGPVQVHLSAQDGNTGHARSGVQRLAYRLDGGAWREQSGVTLGFTVSSDGAHTLEYYAVDNVGNQESHHTITFQIDQTPPSPPSGVSESSGVVHDQWQKEQNTPTFTWTASSDAVSGVWGYQFYFGKDPRGVGYQTFRAAEPRQWTPQPGGVHTGVYYLRGRARDNAGHWSDWTNLFTLRYDETPPENPGDVSHAAGIVSTVWQRVTSAADFSWLTPPDEGSGVKGYYAYWGADPDGTSTALLTAPRFQDATSLCEVDAVCTGYLRLRSVDNVDNLANEWSTGFILRYDNVPPTVDLAFNGGVTSTNQAQVVLNIDASDQGSGVEAMRFSADGQDWTPWEIYSAERAWTIPRISRRFWPVYVQVRDGVELESEVISRTIYLDVNLRQPRSMNFRLFDHTMSAGAGSHTSAAYDGRSTVGQVADAPTVSSTNYILSWGYEAGSQALPLIVPGHEYYNFINGVFASGTGATAMSSSGFTMLGTFNEVGLPVGTTTLASVNFQHQPGFLAAVPMIHPSDASPTQTVGPPPPPEPELPCEIAQIYINDDAAFTNDISVTLNMCAPRAVEMMVSNDETFVGAIWEPFTTTKSWTLLPLGQFVSPRFVYAAFKEANGVVQETYFDDIIYDPNLPSGNIMVGESVPANLALAVAQSNAAQGASSQPFRVGEVTYMQELGDVKLSQPLPLLSATANGSMNVQKPVWDSHDRIFATLPVSHTLVYLPLVMAQYPSLEGYINIFVDGRDDNSGVVEMQISTSAVFTDTVWEPYSALKLWSPIGEDGVKTVYARLRDSAGNVSEVSEVSFVYDTNAPVGNFAFAQRAVGPDTITNTIYFWAEDNLSGVADIRISRDAEFVDTVWLPYTTTLTWPIPSTTQSQETLYVQYRDLAGNISETYSNAYFVDTEPPVVYVDVSLGNTLKRTVTVYAYDELSGVAMRRLSNDPMMIEGVVTLPHTSTVEWTFDERRVVWVQVEDSVGNASTPYPTYAQEQHLHANFVASPTIGVAPLTVAFTNTSTGIYATSLWTFGDDITSTLEGPSHAYMAPGVYTVTLTVSGLNETDTLTRTNYITVE
jgi:PKD repeat protein